MKRFMPLVLLSVLAGGLALLGSGCGIRIYYSNQPVPTPVPSFPNAQQIESRCQGQSDRIAAGVQSGNLGQYTGQGLMENVAVVRNASVQYRQPTGMQQDLTGDQTLFLNNMLNDNSAAIDNALQRHSQWNAWYGGSHPGNYDSATNRTIYISYYNSRLNDMDYTINSNVQSGQISNDDARDLHAKVQVSRQMEWNYYQQNGHMRLTKRQIQRLNKNLDDNGRYIAERTHTRRAAGGWLSPKRPWRSNQQGQSDQGSSQTQSQQSAQPTQPVTHAVDNGRWNARAVPTATPVPAPKPAPTPVVTGRSGSLVKPAVTPMVNHGSQQTQSTAAKPAAPKMVSVKPLSDRVNGQNNRVMTLFKAHKISPPAAVALGKKINTLKAMIKNPNQQVTQDQYNGMAKMADDIDKGMPK